MNIQGEYTLHQLEPTQVWDGLLNPSLLVKVLPYAQNLTFLAPEKQAILNLYGTFGQQEPQKIHIDLSFTDHQRPHQYNFQFHLQTENKTGVISGQGAIYVKQAAHKSDTALQYTLNGTAEGIFHQTGDLLLETLTRSYLRETITGLGSVLRQEELVTPLPVTPPPPNSTLEPWLFATAVAIVPLIMLFIWRRLHQDDESAVNEK